MLTQAMRWLSRRNSDQTKAKTSAIAMACMAVAFSSNWAVADVVDECRQAGPESLRSCTAVIASPRFSSDEKLLAHRHRGAARINAGFNRLAIADFTEVIRLNKEDWVALSDRGRAKLADGDLSGSIADFSSAIRVAPFAQRSGLYTKRGHVRIVGKQLDAAMGDLNEAIRLDPSDAQAWNTRGIVYLKKHDFGRAVDDYTAAIGLLPSPVIYENRGYAFEAQSLVEQAIADFRIALDGDPSSIGARDALNRLRAPVDATGETNQRVRKGAALAEKSCSGCHSVGPTGESPQKNATEFRNYYKKQPLFALKTSITRAMREIHYETKDQNLNSAKVQLSDAEIDTVVAYINSLSTAARLGLSETTGTISR